MLKIVYAFFLGILLAISVGMGVAAFYPQPEGPTYPSELNFVNKEPTQQQQQSLPLSAMAWRAGTTPNHTAHAKAKTAKARTTKPKFDDLFIFHLLFDEWWINDNYYQPKPPSRLAKLRLKLFRHNSANLDLNSLVILKC